VETIGVVHGREKMASSEAKHPTKPISAFSCELEDWFHILDSDHIPTIDAWPGLPLHAEKSVDRLLDLLEENGAKATFFCLGWMAERMPEVVRRCWRAGHEIASHGYGHVLAYQVGRQGYWDDIVRAKKILEDLIGEEVVGFRSPGFCVKEENRWVFDVVAQAGYRYDASVFPARHAHGGLRQAEPGPHVIATESGPLVEIPTSTVNWMGRRVCLFGGGYLRIAPLPLIRWGIRRLYRQGQPLIVYMHPREIDPSHPRLPLPLMRRFKCYVNLCSTLPKLQWLCAHHGFVTMRTLAERVGRGIERRPVAEIEGRQPGPGLVEIGRRTRPASAEQVPST